MGMILGGLYGRECGVCACRGVRAYASIHMPDRPERSKVDVCMCRERAMFSCVQSVGRCAELPS